MRNLIQYYLFCIIIIIIMIVIIVIMQPRIEVAYLRELKKVKCFKTKTWICINQFFILKLRVSNVSIYIYIGRDSIFQEVCQNNNTNNKSGAIIRKLVFVSFEFINLKKKTTFFLIYNHAFFELISWCCCC